MRLDAAFQQADDLGWEAAKVHQDALLRLQRLEVLLADFQGVQQEEVILAGQVDAQDLVVAGCTILMSRCSVLIGGGAVKAKGSSQCGTDS